MWFDAQAALIEIEVGAKTNVSALPFATSATTATCEALPVQDSANVAKVAVVAGHQQRKLKITPSASDPETYLAFLGDNGPASYGAVAVALGWGATRAWQAEARLRAKGLVFVK
jgi:hypothetical protein